MAGDHAPSEMSSSPAQPVEGSHGAHVEHDDHSAHGEVILLDRAVTAPHLVKDIVCGMTVDADTTPHRAEHQGQTYYFCSASCRTKFVAEPQRYLTGKPKAPEPVPQGTIYTCLMHPEVRQIGPGSCPICGMALEPVMVAAEAGPKRRTHRHDAPILDRPRADGAGRSGPVRRTRAAVSFLARKQPVKLAESMLQMIGHPTPVRAVAQSGLSNWVQLALASPIVLWVGWPFFVRGWQSILPRNLNMFTLIAIATGVAWVYSVIATFTPDLFLSAFRATDGSVAIYFEAAAGITVLALLGQVLELRARERTSGAIRALLDLALPPPETAQDAETRAGEGYDYIDWYFSKKPL